MSMLGLSHVRVATCCSAEFVPECPKARHTLPFEWQTISYNDSIFTVHCSALAITIIGEHSSLLCNATSLSFVNSSFFTTECINRDRLQPVSTENLHCATLISAADEEVLTEGEVQAEIETDPAQIALVVVKRQAPELSANCMVYRYGSLATSVDVARKSCNLTPRVSKLNRNSVGSWCCFFFHHAEGIESVEIVQMSNVVSLSTELAQNAVDITVSCQGR